jgi:hypothetical protein
VKFGSILEGKGKPLAINTTFEPKQKSSERTGFYKKLNLNNPNLPDLL